MASRSARNWRSGTGPLVLLLPTDIGFIYLHQSGERGSAVYSALLDAYLEAITTGNTEDSLKSLSGSSSSALLLWADLNVALDWIKLKESMRSDSATKDEQDAAFGALLESIRRDLGHSDLKLNWRRFFQ